MVGQLAEGAEGIATGRTDAHRGVWLHHDGGGAGLPGAVHHVCHQVQAGLQQQAVVSSKQLLVHQLLDLREENGRMEGQRYPELNSLLVIRNLLVKMNM